LISRKKKVKERVMDAYKEPFKLAFIGGAIDSAIGYTHYIASQMDHRFVLKAGCFSINEKSNKKTALTWGIEEAHLYYDWKELLSNELDYIDAVVILTPTPEHYTMIMEALSLGYAVISEKALAMSHQEGIRICRMIEEKKAFFAVTHNYTGYPMLRELQSMINEGKLGRITHINIEMPQESFLRWGSDGETLKPQDWRLYDGKISSISLDLGAHLQHMIYFLTGENPYELVADESNFGLFDNIIDDISCISRYPSGMKTMMWYGKSSIGHRNGLRIRVYGTKGSVEWYQMEPEEIVYHTIKGEKLILDRASLDVSIATQHRYNRFKSGHPAGFIEAFGNLYVDIAQKLEQYKEDGNHNLNWTYDAIQATKGLEIFEAIKVSSIEKRWVKIGENIL
jgi:predicted dehydrogenase